MLQKRQLLLATAHQDLFVLQRWQNEVELSVVCFSGVILRIV